MYSALRDGVMRFFYYGFFIKQDLLVPIYIPRMDFDFCGIFVYLFIVVNDSLVYLSRGSQDS